MKLLVKNVIPIRRKAPVNILIEEGVITAVGDKAPEADKVITADGAYVSPGWFDMRAFFADPGLEHKETIATGCRAAAAGGFTEVALLPNTNPGVQSKNEVSYLINAAKGPVRIYPFGAVTDQTEGKEITEMIDMHQAGAVAFTDGSKSIWNTGIMLKTLQYLQKFDGLLINRPEDKVLAGAGVMHEGEDSTLLGMPGVPAAAEEIGIMRDLQLLEYTGGKLHFATISTARSVQLIREAKARGLAVTCDVAIHQLIYTAAHLANFDTHYKVRPPYRDLEDIEALKEGLLDGTIDVIVTDHSPHDLESKELEFDLADFGITGLQTMLHYLSILAEELPLELLIDKITQAPRALLQLPQVALEVGSPANLTVFDMKGSWKLDKHSNRSKATNSPLWGETLQGVVLATVLGHDYYSHTD